MYCAPQYKFFGPHMGVLYAKYDLLVRVISARRAARRERNDYKEDQ